MYLSFLLPLVSE